MRDVQVGVDNGEVIVQDRFLTGYSYGRSDEQQGGADDVTLESSSIDGGNLHAVFSRPIAASDDYDVSLEGCESWRFVTRKGSRIGSVDIAMH